MNTPFNAFQVRGKPKMSTTERKHVRLKKSMSLPDDTLEYWGFFLPNSSTVTVSVCSRYDGFRLLVVKGEKNLRNCGLMQPSIQFGAQMAEGQGKVYVNFKPAVPEVEENTEFGNVNVGKEIIDEEDSFKDFMLPLSNSTLDTPIIYNGTGKRLRTENDTDSESIIERKKKLEKTLIEGDELELKERNRTKRSSSTKRLDGGIAHGGNALNFTNVGNDSSLSSFENSLLTCYSGQILLNEGFLAYVNCTGLSYLETGQHMTTVHEVIIDGYYYYIFYSDNDYVQNDIYTIFDIYKPTYEYGNYSVGCINKTQCTFPIKFWSDEVVVVEVPTRDGIENENDDITILVSTCIPRTAVYAIFPLAIIFTILLCAFL